uniref:BTB domain-containing protein n=1 Tax=Globodera rostochiensis TaxID=31243 RepID=A0A914I6A6_GLORO
MRTRPSTMRPKLMRERRGLTPLVGHHRRMEKRCTFSHSDERQSIVLLSEKVMRALVRHVSEAPAMDHRLGRALRRLARHQMGLQKMLEMDFCQMIIKHLFRRPCLLTRFAKPCIRCAYRRDFGIFLLGDHAILADSSMGAETGRVRALAAALVLLRKDEHRTRFHHNFQPIDALLDAVARLVKEMMCSSDQRQLDEHTEEGQLCCDVLSALSSMLQCHQQIFESVGNGRQLFGPKGKSIQPAESVGSTHCVLEAKNAVAMSDDETLKFLDKNGLSLVAEVPKRELCTYNEYFMGMFGSEFLERLTGRNQFVFDADAECSSQEDFVKFLHFSIGCGLQSECVQVASAECCVALLRLADKYLCTRLLDHLLQSDKASRFITGHTLRLFLPLVLTVPTVGDGGGLTCVCALVLLRYCTDAQALDVLQLLGVRDASQHQYRMAATTPLPALSLVDALCNALGTFVRPFAALTPQRGKKGGLMRDPLLDPSAYWDFR